MTALAMAARGNAPVVVFAGDAPIGASWYIQSIDQAPLALATGAHFVPIRTIQAGMVIIVLSVNGRPCWNAA
jgi:acetolactate synthase-1/2/3 large subunit